MCMVVKVAKATLTFLLYSHTNDGVIDDFPKISEHLPKISEYSLKFVQRSHER